MNIQLAKAGRLSFLIIFTGLTTSLAGPSNPSFFSGRDGASASSIIFSRITRDKLTAADLLSGGFSRIVSNEYFMPIGPIGPAASVLSGIIQFSETPMNTTRPDGDWSGTGQRLFPAFSLPVISDGDRLIPLERDIIYAGNKGRSFWNVIVSPGRVWREAGDGEYSRASFPFVLTDNYVGQALNGLATFVFNASAVSSVAIQISQETSPIEDYAHADFASSIPVLYTPRSFPDAGSIVREYERELAARPAIRDWADLSAGAITRTLFNDRLSPEQISITALLLEGILYVQPAETRTGPYPYPLDMRQGAYSVTKTLAMGLSMFHLAERYGEGIFDELITDYVPALAAHDGWRGVTFGHALGMATGTQGNDNNLIFIRARAASDKLASVRDMPDAPSAPGTSFNYSSSNTFTLSYALQQYVRKKEGSEADYWTLVCDNVLKPIGLAHLPLVRTIESDGSRGVPIMGWGSYPTVIEAAVIGRLLSNEGLFEGRQLLNKNKVREALERSPRRGLPAGQMSRQPSRYFHSFWIADVPLSTGIVVAPYMAGRGGNFVVVLPDGIVAIRFADHDGYEIKPMVAIAEVYRRKR